MIELKTVQGILVLIDAVNFTTQAARANDRQLGEYSEYFQGKIGDIAGKHGFTSVKTLGDAVLVFGSEPRGLLDIMRDLFDRDKPENKYGFESRFRMAAHTGYFQLKMDGDTPVDLVSAEGIKVFRMEKYADASQLMVTHPLYQGLKHLLSDFRIEMEQMRKTQPLKGFDNEDWFHRFYKLTLLEKTETVDLLTRQMEQLEKDVQQIPVFGNIFKAVDMKDNFINLSLACAEGTDNTLFAAPARKGGRLKEMAAAWEKKRNSKGKPYPGMDEAVDCSPSAEKDEWLLEHHLDAYGSVAGLREINVERLASESRGGIIFGLPGAGKTTILRHLAYLAFTHGRSRRPQVVVLVPCRDIPAYEEWYRSYRGTKAAEPDWETALAFMTWVFLFPVKEGFHLTPGQWRQYQRAVERVKNAYKENRLTLLVDALDEAAAEKREGVMQLARLLYPEDEGWDQGLELEMTEDEMETDDDPMGNRLFLTTRPSERVHSLRKGMAVFNVMSLTMDQVRQVARLFMDENSAVFHRFDEAVWQEEMVVKMAATPMTALLVTAYFQAYGKFDHRYPMYDLLMKFILIKVWDDIKKGAFSDKNLELLFQRVKKQDWCQTNKEAPLMYDALAKLCFGLFYKAGGIVRRKVPEETLIAHFTTFIEEHVYYKDRAKSEAEAERWLDYLKGENLLLPVGTGYYIILHSTVMEFLAARYLTEQMDRDPGALESLVRLCLTDETVLELETVSIAAGAGMQMGLNILAVIRDMKAEWQGYKAERLADQGVKCLAEVEWQLKKMFDVVVLDDLRQPVLDELSRNREAVEWVYGYLQDRVLTRDKDQLRTDAVRFQRFFKLSGTTFTGEYVVYPVFNNGDSELVALRRKLLYQLVQDERVEEWLVRHGALLVEPTVGGAGDTVWQLDSEDYDPEDKNFNYYRGIMGNSLVGILGSPNFHHNGGVLDCAFSPDGETIVSASDDHTLMLWDARSGKEIRTFKGHKAYVRSSAFSPDGVAIISASDDKTLKLWDARSGKEISTFVGHKWAVYSCAFSPNGKTIISASDDMTLRLWNTSTGKEILILAGHDRGVNSCIFSPDGETIISASEDKTLKLWNARTGKEIRAFNGHTDRVWSSAFSPDGETIISASEDSTLKLWDVHTGKAIHTFSGHFSDVNRSIFSPNGKTIVSASDDKTLKIWDAHTGREIYSFSGHKNYVCSSAFSPNGKTIISASSDHTLKLWDARTGKEIRAFTGHNYSVHSSAFSPDGATIVSASEDHTLKLWDAHSGKEIRTFTGHDSCVNSGAFSPDGTTIVSASEDHTLKLWDARSGKEICVFTGHAGRVWSGAFSPDGETIVSASSDHSLKLWDARSGKEIRAFTGHNDRVLSSAFSPDGETIISASGDHTLKLWDAGSSKEIRAFTGHNGYVYSSAFSPDGATIVSVSADRTLKLWETATGKEILSIPLPWRPLHVSVSIKKPGLVLTANGNGTLALFDFKEVFERTGGGSF